MAQEGSVVVATADDVAKFAELVNSGLRPMDARERMGLTKGRAAYLLAIAKKRKLVAGTDFAWMRALQRQAGDKTRDALAELVAEGATPAEAGRTLGVSSTLVSRHWRRIVDGLGPQAV